MCSYSKCSVQQQLGEDATYSICSSFVFDSGVFSYSIFCVKLTSCCAVYFFHLVESFEPRIFCSVVVGNELFFGFLFDFLFNDFFFCSEVIFPCRATSPFFLFFSRSLLDSAFFAVSGSTLML